MKTIGEILKNKREEKKLTPEAVEQKIKIRKKYLLALENDEWQKLPSLTYARGFIKNYTEFLGLDLNYVLPVFRRQLNQQEKAKIVPPGISQPLNEPFFRLTPSKIIGALVIILLFLFFSWLFNQYHSFISIPTLIIEKPTENELIKGEKVQVVGRTDSWATLTINGQRVELIDGKFSQEIGVSPGRVSIDISVVNKFGKKQEVRRTVRVESP